MKRWTYLAIIFVLLLASCASEAESPCGDGVCEGPENAGNCPQDCTVPAGAAPAADEPAKEKNGSDLAKSVEMTVTTSTMDNGYGMTVTGVITFDLDFPAEGGEAALTMGSAKITDYAWEQIPGCEVKVADGLVGAVQAITYEKIEYTSGGFIIFTAPISYESPKFEVTLDCKVTGSTPVPDMPFSKVLGLFNEKYTTLSFKPEQDFNGTLTWGMNDAFSSTVVIKVK